MNRMIQIQIDIQTVTLDLDNSLETIVFFTFNKPLKLVV